MFRKYSVAVLFLAAMVVGGGCVERKMVITSEPSGATVVVNQTWKGVTPYVLPFKHYGTYDILITHKDCYPLHVAEPVAAPLYEQPGVDIVSEVLLPTKVKDVRKLHYKLEKLAKPDNLEDILSRNDAMRAKSEEISERRRIRDEKRNPKELPLHTKKEEKEAKKEKEKAREEAVSEPELEGKNADKTAPEETDDSAAKADGPEIE
ncbi:MAG: PEGA domain-containing protein [Planctomycetes bacterium]|nr:PEGA domain-containing protein [Planctomycetota bacterium]